MKITSSQEVELEKHATIVENNRLWPWGEKCPCCNRPHVFEYSDGSKVCAKCDELVMVGSCLLTQNSVKIPATIPAGGRGWRTSEKEGEHGLQRSAGKALMVSPRATQQRLTRAPHVRLERQAPARSRRIYGTAGMVAAVGSLHGRNPRVEMA